MASRAASRPAIAAGTLRFRIAFGFFAGAVVVSGFVAASTFALARTYLTRQRTDAALRQSYNSLRFATEFLARPDEVHRPERLVAFLQTRGTSEILVQAGPRSVSSSVSLALDTVPAELVDVVGGGGVAWTILDGEPRRLAFGSPVPNTQWRAYLVYGLRDLDDTLGLLARILAGTAAVSAAVAAALGWRIARTTIEPLRRASEAAQRVAEGLTDSRLVQTGDELGLLAASFNEMAAALQERIARERRFVADASHELRTPLTGLKTSVDFLNARPEDLPPRLQSVAALAADEVRSLQRLVDDLLELSRVEAGAVDVASERVDLASFAHEVARRRAPGHDIAIEAAAPGPVVRTDKTRLERIVGNLVENAMVHGEGRDVRIRVSADGADGVLVVSDAGPGIPVDRVSRIFERFWRADESRRRGAGSGAGLGLAIARENANLIGAEVDVTSSGAAGTTFTVRIPRAVVAPGDARAPDAELA